MVCEAAEKWFEENDPEGVAFTDRLGILALDSVAQQQRAAFQSFAARQRHRRHGGSVIDLRVGRVEDARCPPRAVHSWT
jgi:hypothetical protein